MNKAIKNIIFDLGGVLLDLDFSRTWKSLETAGGKITSELLPPFKEDSIFRSQELGKIDNDTFYKGIRELTQSSLSDKEIDAIWNAMLLHFPAEKLNLLLKLKDQYRIFLLSNTNDIHWKYVIHHFLEPKAIKAEDVFEGIYLSHEMHLSKPDPAIFQEVLKKEHLIPQETLFIDDSEANCLSAEQLGIHTHHYLVTEPLKDIFE